MADPLDRRREFIEREQRTRDLFLRFLHQEKGYPEEALGINIVIGPRFRPDVAIVDPATKEILALVEVTSAIDTLPKVKANYAVQLLAYRATTKPVISLYFVAPDPEPASNTGFRLFQIDDKGQLVSIAPHDFPSFLSLRNTVVAGTIQTVEAKQRTTEDKLRLVVLLLALLLAVLIVASVADLWQPTWEFLALLAGLVGIAILPYTKELRILGFSIKRLTEPDE
jgi:hypothetical protein